MMKKNPTTPTAPAFLAPAFDPTIAELNRVIEQLAGTRTDHGRIPADMLLDAAERVGRSRRTMLRLVHDLLEDGTLPSARQGRKVRLTDDQKELARATWFKYAGNMKATHEALQEIEDFPVMGYKTFTRVVSEWPEYLRSAAVGGFGEMMKKQGVFAEHIPYRTHTYGIDHTKLPIRVRTSRGSDEWVTPWLTIVLDLYSRTIVAWRLSLETPDAQTVMEVLSESFVIVDTPDGQFGGLPQHLRSDNGSDLASNDLRHALLDLEVHHDFTVPYTARQNGRVERTHRTIKGRFPQTQPGYMEGLDAQKELRIRRTKVEIDDLLTIDELATNFGKWVDEKFHQMPHPEFKSLTRMQVWHESPEPLSKIDDFERWAAMLHRENRRLHRYGIEFRHVIYQHPDLAALYSKERGTIEVEVRSSRRFPAEIFVFYRGVHVCNARAANDMSDAERGALAATRVAQDEKAHRLMIAANHDRGLDAEEQLRDRASRPEPAGRGLEFLDDAEDITFAPISKKEAS